MSGTMWHDMFHLGMPVAEKILRPVIVYVFLVGGLRIGGKRELAQLNPFDLVVLLMLSNTVQNAIIGDDNSIVGGLLGAATLLTVNYVVVRFLFSHQKLEQFVEGDTETLVVNGQVDSAVLKKNFITHPELEAAAHRQGFESLDEVERAILEPGGTFSFIRRIPSAETVRYRELIDRLDRISSDVQALRDSRPGTPGTPV
jgi:uncharacterized membrane protein YcaP (DUF421 family)